MTDLVGAARSETIESFKNQTHLNAIVSEAQEMVNNALGASGDVHQAGVRQ